MRALIVFCISFVLALALIPLANAQFCGDGACNAGEESWCSADCYCGNGVCESGESSWCSADCVSTPAQFCGDGTCDSGESSWCTTDCTVTPASFCGDGTCDSGESSWCTADCPVTPAQFCGDGTCNAGEESWCSLDCTTTPQCTSAAWSCPDFSMISCPASGLKSRSCTLIDSTCSNPDVVRPSLTQSCAPPPPTVVNNPPSISFELPSFALPGTTISVTATATDSDSYGVSRVFLVYQNDVEIPNSATSCGGSAACSATFHISLPAAYDSSYSLRVNATDTAGKVSQLVKTASTARQCTLYAPEQKYNPGTVIQGGLPVSLQGQCSTLDGKAECKINGAWTMLQCFPAPVVTKTFYKCSADSTQILSCTVTNENPSISDCSAFTIYKTCTASNVCQQSFVDKTIVPVCQSTGPGPSCTPSWSCTTWSDFSNQCGTRTCTDANACGTTAGKPAEFATCPAPSCTPSWQCTTWSNPANSCGTRTCSDSNGCGTSAGKPAESASCPVPGDASPVITSFAVPATVDASSSYTVSVTATDDNGVSSMAVFNSDGSAASPSQPCGGILSCTRSFIVNAPSAFDFVFHLVAKAFDTISQSVSSSSSDIRTNPEVPVVVPPVVNPEDALQGVDVSVHSEALFVSGAIPDSSCLSPGSDTFMFVRLGNGGSSTLRDVKVTAYVPDLDLWSVSGPFSIGKGDSTSRFLPFSIPDGAPSDEYFIRIQATAGKDSVVKYRIVEVSQSC